MSLEHLQSPLRLASLQLRNRIVVTAHFTGLSGAPIPGERDLAYLEERAAGGAALLVTEGMAVHPTSRASTATWMATDPAILPALASLAERVHRHGAAVFGQLRHQGRTMLSRASRLPLWAPSPLPGSYYHEIPHAMDRREIAEVVAGFELGARHIRAAGLDGVELNAAHGFLLHAFLSPYANQRTDAYGGSEENRLRLLIDVCQAIRSALGSSLVLGVRLSTSDFTSGGLDPEAVARVGAVLAERQLADYLSLSQSNYELWSMSAMVPDMYAGQAPYTALARQVRLACGLPVVAAGGVRDPAIANAVLARGDADLVGMTRALIADPYLPQKVSTLSLHAVRPCIACNVCWDSLARGTPVRCAVNPEVGFEGQASAAPESRRVLVIGGGVAGLEAARVAAGRGHQVVLFERNQTLGGQVALAAMAEGRAELGLIVAWLERATLAAGVDIRRGHEASLCDVLDLAPDAVVVATGARPEPGTTFPSDRPIEDGWRPLTDEVVPAGRVAILDADHGWEALALAGHLATRGARVELVTEQLTFGLEIPAISLHAALARLKHRGVRLHSSTRPLSYQDGRLLLADVHTGEFSREIQAERVLVAGCRRADDALLGQLRARPESWQVLAIGDCQAPRGILQAIWEGHQAGREIGLSV